MVLGCPLISIVTPCLNASPTILANLHSVAETARWLHAQEFSLEQWLIDGGSKDDTRKIVMTHLSSIPKLDLGFYSLFFESALDFGVYDGMNKGLSKAAGLYAHILNADDFIIDPKHYATEIVRAYSQSTQIILGSIYYFKRPGLKWSHQWNVSPISDGHSCWQKQLDKGLHYPHPGFICRTEDYKRVGFDIRYKIAADYKLMYLLLRNCPNDSVIVVNEWPLVAMDVAGVSGKLGGIFRGMREIKAIQKELGIRGSLLKRYASKLLNLIAFRLTSFIGS